MQQNDKTPYANWYPHPIQNATESSFTNTKHVVCSDTGEEAMSHEQTKDMIGKREPTI